MAQRRLLRVAEYLDEAIVDVLPAVLLVAEESAKRFGTKKETNKLKLMELHLSSALLLTPERKDSIPRVHELHIHTHSHAKNMQNSWNTFGTAIFAILFHFIPMYYHVCVCC